jgi:hypothetical protein
MLDADMEMLEHIDTMLSAGRFAECDELLRSFSPEAATTQDCVNILAFTLAAKLMLADRPATFDRIEATLVAREPERHQRLLVGLK